MVEKLVKVLMLMNELGFVQINVSENYVDYVSVVDGNVLLTLDMDFELVWLDVDFLKYAQSAGYLD